MLEVSQLYEHFITAIESVSEAILDFWEILLHSSQTKRIFTMGLGLNDKLKMVHKLISRISDYEGYKDAKPYIMMA